MRRYHNYCLEIIPEICRCLAEKKIHALDPSITSTPIAVPLRYPHEQIKAPSKLAVLAAERKQETLSLSHEFLWKTAWVFLLISDAYSASIYQVYIGSKNRLPKIREPSLIRVGPFKSN